MTMGVVRALMEELTVDKQLDLFVDHDLVGPDIP